MDAPEGLSLKRYRTNRRPHPAAPHQALVARMQGRYRLLQLPLPKVMGGHRLELPRPQFC